MKRLNLHIYQTPLTHESRVQRETRSIVETGHVDLVLLAGLGGDGLPEHEVIDAQREIYRIAAGRLRFPFRPIERAVNLSIWMVRVFRCFRNRAVAVVNCHSLAVLPLGVLLRWRSGARLIYDPHELETEKEGWRGLTQLMGRALESALVHSADSVIVVSRGIADWYRKAYGLQNVFVVRNFPRRSALPAASSLLKDRLAIDQNEILFIFQGNLTDGRGVELLLDVFTRASGDKHIVFMGFGSLEAEVRRHAEIYPNIHFQEAVRADEIPLYTSSADVGFNLPRPSCINHLHSLPNKIFEYLGSGIPVIVSNFPEMGGLIEEHRCGWVTEPESEAVLRLVNSLSRNSVDVAKKAVLECRDRFAWEDEAVVYADIYKGLTAAS